MARTPNYAFEKRKKDLERQQLKAEKAERKRLRAAEGKPEEEDGEGVAEGSTPEAPVEP